MNKIKEIFAEISLLMKLDSSIIEKLEELNKRVSELESKTQEVYALAKQCETRFAEIQYLVKSSLKQGYTNSLKK